MVTLCTRRQWPASRTNSRRHKAVRQPISGDITAPTLKRHIQTSRRRRQPTPNLQRPSRPDNSSLHQPTAASSDDYLDHRPPPSSTTNLPRPSFSHHQPSSSFHTLSASEYFRLRPLPSLSHHTRSLASTSGQDTCYDSYEHSLQCHSFRKITIVATISEPTTKCHIRYPSPDGPPHRPPTPRRSPAPTFNFHHRRRHSHHTPAAALRTRITRHEPPPSASCSTRGTHPGQALTANPPSSISPTTMNAHHHRLVDPRSVPLCPRH